MKKYKNARIQKFKNLKIHLVQGCPHCVQPHHQSKHASQMHVAPRIVVHCWQYAQDVAPDMPRMMLLSTADIIELIIANVSQCFPYNLLQQFPIVLQKYSLKQKIKVPVLT